ncbi:porin [Nostoc sp. T09]|uniref:iron uptake porin n=1 Tax=Nostoc sp. T09 TaxID=1932621 RepID=UPI000B6EF968|nr:iron uptake porin [Nostoc sp. T09]OUL24617.1 porin [Nostoc sp. T09]
MFELKKILASPMVKVAAIATSSIIISVSPSQATIKDGSTASQTFPLQETPIPNLSNSIKSEIPVLNRATIKSLTTADSIAQSALGSTITLSDLNVADANPVEPLPNVITPASELENERSSADESMGQINSVAQFSDVQPTDWAFQALQSLVERYGCIAGYPNGTFRGNRAITRYEFAAGINACLERINELIATATSDLVKKEDLTSLQRLQEEFSAELAALRGRVDTLTARTTELEANQFSTTTKLLGNVIVQTNAYFSGDQNAQANIQYLTFLGFLTSFTGRDLLVTGIGTTNTTFPETAPNNNGRDVGGTREGASNASGAGDLGNNFRIIGLEYQFPLGDNLNVNVIAGNRYRFSPILLSKYAPYYISGVGPVGTFSEAPPIFLIGGGSGISLSYKVLDSTVVNLSYLATFGDNSTFGGLFKGEYVAAAQVNYNPNPGLFLQFVYQHGYFGPGNFGFNNGQGFRGNGFVGTALANRFDDAGVLFDRSSAVTTNAYSLGGYFALSPKFAIGGWANLIKARLLGLGDADIWTYSIQAAFPDLFRKGNHGGLIVGVEPTLTGVRSNVPYAAFKNDTSLHIEAYYAHRVSDKISITPSLTWITAPNQDADNKDIVIGGLRTTFSF